MEQMTIDERRKAIEHTLDEYEHSVGIPRANPPGAEEELNEYLNMSRDELKNLSPTDCGEIAYRLARFSLYIQRLVNHEKARRTWAGDIARQIIAPLLSSYDKYTKYSVKIDLISQENESLRKLRDIMRYSKQRMQRLDYVANGIRYMSEVISNLRWAKVSERKANEAQ